MHSAPPAKKELPRDGGGDVKAVRNTLPRRPGRIGSGEQAAAKELPGRFASCRAAIFFDGGELFLVNARRGQKQSRVAARQTAGALASTGLASVSRESLMHLTRGPGDFGRER